MTRAMRLDPSNGASRPMPTSLCISSHGRGGSIVFPRGKGKVVSVVRIVEKILKRLPAELRPFLFHVHFDSCESLKGVKESLPGVTISGFNAEVDINASAMLYQNYIAAAVQRVIARPDGEVVDCAKLVADELIRQARLLSSLQAQAASDDSLADVSSAFMVLYPKIPLVSTTQQSNTPLSHESAYHKFINCDGSCKKNTVIRGVRFAHLTNDDDRCSRCFAALDESEQGKYSTRTAAVGYERR